MWCDFIQRRFHKFCLTSTIFALQQTSWKLFADAISCFQESSLDIRHVTLLTPMSNESSASQTLTLITRLPITNIVVNTGSVKMVACPLANKCQTSKLVENIPPLLTVYHGTNDTLLSKVPSHYQSSASIRLSLPPSLPPSILYSPQSVISQKQKLTCPPPPTPPPLSSRQPLTTTPFEHQAEHGWLPFRQWHSVTKTTEQFKHC